MECRSEWGGILLQKNNKKDRTVWSLAFEDRLRGLCSCYESDWSV